MKLDNIIKITPVLTALLIVCSNIKQSIYYNFFGIRIIEYVEMSELIFMFIDDVITYSILFLFIIGIRYFQHNVLKSKHANFQNKIEESRQIKEFARIIFQFSMLLLILLVLGLALFFIHKGDTRFIFIVSAAISTIALSKFYDRSILFSPWIGVVLIVPYFLYVSAITALQDIQNVQKDAFKNLVTLKFNEEIITSDAANIYLGRTRNYTFIYNKLREETTVYTNSDIKQLIFTK